MNRWNIQKNNRLPKYSTAADDFIHFYLRPLDRKTGTTVIDWRANVQKFNTVQYFNTVFVVWFDEWPVIGERTCVFIQPGKYFPLRENFDPETLTLCSRARRLWPEVISEAAEAKFRKAYST